MWQCSGFWDGNCAALDSTRSASVHRASATRSMQAQAGAMPANKVATAKPKLAVCKTLASFIEPSVDLVRDT